MSDEPSGAFPPTAWSMIGDAKDRQSPGYLQAMNRLIGGYWRPVYYFLRARGYSTHQAEDLTQEFFLQLFDRQWVRNADRDRGRFRTLLLTILTRFLSDRGTERAPRQRLFDDRLVSISALVGDRERSYEPAVTEPPEDLFMKHWAASVLANVRRSLETWCQERRRPDWYEIFCAVHFPLPGSRPMTQEALAGHFRVTRDQVRYASEEVKKQFVRLLRAEVAAQVDSAEEVDLEISEITGLLAR